MTQASGVTAADPNSCCSRPVLKLCGMFGTSCTNSTGEVDWVRHMGLMYQGTAQQIGPKTISFCGRDSVP